jgi:hypothetical protein
VVADSLGASTTHPGEIRDHCTQAVALRQAGDEVHPGRIRQSQRAYPSRDSGGDLRRHFRLTRAPGTRTEPWAALRKTIGEAWPLTLPSWTAEIEATAQELVGPDIGHGPMISPYLKRMRKDAWMEGFIPV